MMPNHALQRTVLALRARPAAEARRYALQDMKALLLVACLFANSAVANAEEPEPFVRTPLGMFVVGEALVAVNAGLATINPEAYGALGVLLFPLGALGGEGQSSTALRWTGLVLAEGLAIYHLEEMDKDRDSDGEIYLKSTVSWHVFAGLMLGAAWLTGDLNSEKSEPDSQLSFQYRPHSHGATLGIRYVF